jgi:hypothetical protein
MKGTLLIPWDSRHIDMGVTDLIDRHRDLFERVSGREEIASTMTRLLEGRRSVTRQMVEKWFIARRGQRTIPSSVLFIALLAACERIKINNEKNEKAA